MDTEVTGGQDHQDGQESHEDLEAQAKGKASQVSAATQVFSAAWVSLLVCNYSFGEEGYPLPRAISTWGGGEEEIRNGIMFCGFGFSVCVCVCACVCVCVYMHALRVHAGVELMNIQ